MEGCVIPPLGSELPPMIELMKLPYIPPIYKNPIPQNIIDLMDIINRLPSNQFEVFEWQNDKTKLLEMVERVKDFQQFYVEEVEPKYIDIKEVLSECEKKIEKFTDIKPTERNCIDWIFSKYFDRLNEFAGLTDGQIFKEIKAYCDYKNGVYGGEVSSICNEKTRTNKKRIRNDTINRYQEIVTYYYNCLSGLNVSKSVAERRTVENYSISLKTLKRALEKNVQIRQ